VNKEGRTVLFVSHNMTAIQGFCKKAILLKDGQLIDYNDVYSVVNKYLNSETENILEKKWDIDAPGNDIIRLKSYKIAAMNNEPVITVDTGVSIECVFESYKPDLSLGFTMYLTNSQGIILFESGVAITNKKDSVNGIYKVTVEIPGHLLNSDRYYARIVLGESQRYVLANFNDIFGFDIEHTATGRDNNFSKAPGVIRPLLKWRSELISGNE
jgi:lipopolysaccharide transport system ATP-binding protein